MCLTGSERGEMGNNMQQRGEAFIIQAGPNPNPNPNQVSVHGWHQNLWASQKSQKVKHYKSKKEKKNPEKGKGDTVRHDKKKDKHHLFFNSEHLWKLSKSGGYRLLHFNVTIS